ncbi:MAG: hypothetical protein P8J50_03340 [Acidimicrobiales bacterium]|jgi:hypothetical protein|nr:hypothetical protein [Acidimicrobiales bacterium]
MTLRQRMLVVALLTLVVAVMALDARATYGARVTADEPQYLLTALSLGTDLDLDIQDEIRGREYLPFHEVGLNGQTIALREDGQRLSPHDPLLPLVLAIPMALGGWVAAKLFLAAIAAATAAATLALAVRRFGADPRVAMWIVGAFFVAPPLTSYATQVYPAMPAAFTIVLGLWGITGHREARNDALVIAAIIVLPWLAAKYVPHAGVLAFFYGVSALRADRRRLALSVITLAIAGVVYLAVHQRVYGGWTVYAAGDHFVDGEFQVVGTNPNYVGRSPRLVGLLLDRGFGLGAWTPSYLLAPAAIVWLWRSGRPGRGVMCAMAAVGWFVATWVALTMHGWWWPGRQVVPVVPILVVAVALLVSDLGKRLVLVILSSVVGMVTWLWLVFEASTDRRTLIVDFEETSNPWYRVWRLALPNHRVDAGFDNLLTVLWSTALLVSALWAWRSPGNQRAATVEAEAADVVR